MSQSNQEKSGADLPVPTRLSGDAIPSPISVSGNVPPDPVGSASPTGERSEGGLEERLKFSEHAHKYLREVIGLADQKATFLFTGATALLAFLYKNGVSARWLKSLMAWNILDMVAFFAMSSLAVAAFIALLVTIPRTPGSLRGYLFWEAIAEHDSGRDYADGVARLSGASLFQITAEHCYELARVCRRKYKLLRLALYVGAVGLAAALLVFLFASQ